MSDSSLMFYRHTEDSNCGYLPNLQSNSIFIDPDSEPSLDQLNLLHLQGFRRSGKLVYRPQCPECNACHSSRIINADFRASKNQKKAIKRNLDIRLRWVEAEFNEEHYQLYQHYIAQRHQNGEMFPASRDQYKGFLIEGHGTHKFLELRDSENSLIGCCVVDIFYDGLSAIYSYFDPEQAKRSLGRFIVLALISQGQEMGLPYTYLGYWIKNSSKMNYKADYQPLEVFDGETWRKLISNETK
ncbi:MAG: arginyltransferase [Oleispira antarctica]|nr:arginyltransferase [Oleispira antarctica]MBQ0792551.1 arginyltransferase [Oleispira antarctica]